MEAVADGLAGTRGIAGVLRFGGDGVDAAVLTLMEEGIGGVEGF